MAYGDLPYGQGTYKGIGGEIAEQPVDILTDEGKTCLILGLENDHGGGWSQRSGDNWIWPSSVGSVTQLFDAVQQMFEVGLCSRDGLFYILNPMDGVDIDLPFRDKVDPLVADSGHEIECDIYLGEVTGEMRHYNVYDLESHLQFRPVNPDNISATGYNDRGLPDDFAVDVFTRQDGIPTEISRVTDVPVNEDIVQERVVNGRSHQLCLHLSHSAFKLMAVEQYCKIQDKGSSHDNGGLGQSEEQYQVEMARPALWLSRGRLLLNRANGRVLSGSAVSCVGVDGRANSGFDLELYSLNLGNKAMTAGTLLLWHNHYRETVGFVDLGQTSRTWRMLASAPNGDVYACGASGIYRQAGGVGNFVTLGQAVISWFGVAVAPNGNIYACVFGGDIYMQTGGAGNFVALGQTFRLWIEIAASPNGNVYAITSDGGIYMQTGGAGNFVDLGQTSRQWSGIAVSPNGNVYATVNNGDIYMQASGVGNFVALGQTSRQWRGIDVASNGDVYAVVYGGDIYMQTGGAGNFVALGQTVRSWSGVTVTANGNVYASVYGGGIYLRPAGSIEFGIQDLTLTEIPNLSDEYNFSYYRGAIPANVRLFAQCKYFDVRMFNSNISLDAINYYCDNIINHSGDVFLP